MGFARIRYDAMRHIAVIRGEIERCDSEKRSTPHVKERGSRP